MPKLALLDKLNRYEFISDYIGQDTKRADILPIITKKYNITACS